MPLVSVVMPVYNAERHLSAAVESILSQTLTDFELIAVDDGATDSSGAILEGFRQRDRRVRVHHQPRNMGVAVARTTGCQLANGEFIAQMDSDDISLPRRLECQVEFFRTNPNIEGCGTWIEYIDREGQKTGRVWRPPADASGMRWAVLFGMPVAHPTWMMQRTLAERLDYYRNINVEDYDLVMRASRIADLGNVPEILLRYRFWSQSKSSVNARTEAPTTALIIQERWKELLNIDATTGEVLQLQNFIAGRAADEPISSIENAARLVDQIYHRYAECSRLQTHASHFIDTDAAVKLLTLAALAARRSPAVAAQITLRALRIRWTAPVEFSRRALKNLSERRASV